EDSGQSAMESYVAVPHSLRSQGRIDASFEQRDGRAGLIKSYQAGCMRIRVPRGERPGEPPCAVLLNTSGGIAEGDSLDLAVEWGEDTIATVTTQAAEKVYRALAAGSRISTRLTVGRGAQAEWLPQ